MSDEQEEEKSGGKGKSKIMLIIIVVVVLAVLVGGGIFAFNIFGKKDEPEPESGAVSGVITPDMITTYSVQGGEPFKANLTETSDGKRHAISVAVSLGINKTDKKGSAALLLEIEESEVIIQSEVLKVIRGFAYEELNSQAGQDLLSNKILEKMKELFNNEGIVDVYISQMYLT